MPEDFLRDMLNAICKRADDQARKAVRQREDEIRQILGLKVMYMNIITDWGIHNDVEVWCSPKYGPDPGYHIETLVQGHRLGDMVFLPGFASIDAYLTM